MRKVKKIFSTISNIIFYPIFIAILAMIVLFFLGVKPYITMSGSMEPAIHTGSVCFVDTNAEYSEIAVGDVIAFRSSIGLTTHRVISITDQGIETMGDANEVSDGISTTQANFHGKTLFSVPYIGYAIKYLQQPAVIAIVCILIVGSLALSFVNTEEEGETQAQAEANAETAADAEPAEAADPVETAKAAEIAEATQPAENE